MSKYKSSIFLDKPIKDSLVLEKNRGFHEEKYYFDLGEQRLVSSLQLHLKFEGSMFEEKVNDVANYSFCYPDWSQIIEPNKTKLNIVILSLRYRKETIQARGTEGCYVWLTA